jgi:hypothetical protein
LAFITWFYRHLSITLSLYKNLDMFSSPNINQDVIVHKHIMEYKTSLNVFAINYYFNTHATLQTYSLQVNQLNIRK